MAEISVNTKALEEKIQKLRALKEECDGVSVTPQTQVGSGQSIEILKQIDEIYPEIKSAIQTLLSNSVTFFEGVRTSVIEADEKASEKLK